MKRSVTTNTLWTFGSESFSKLVTLLLTILIARHLLAEGFGVFSFAVSFTALFSILVDLGSRLIVVRDIAQGKDTARVLGVVLAIKLLMSIAVIALIVFVVLLMDYPVKMALYLGASIMLIDSFTQTFNAVFQAHSRLDIPGWIKIIRITIRALATIPVIMIDGSLISLLVAFALAQFVGLCLACWWCIRLTGWPSFYFGFSEIQDVIVRSFPFLLASAFVMLYFRIDVTMIALLIGERAVGVYTAAYLFIDALIIVPIAINAALLARIIAHIKKPEIIQSVYSQIARLMMIIAFPLVIGGVITAPVLIQTIFGADFAAAADILRILIWTILPLFIVHFLGSLSIAAHKERRALWLLLFTCLVNIGLNAVLIPLLGAQGAAYATVISEIIYLLLYVHLVGMYIRQRDLVYASTRPLISALVMGVVLVVVSADHIITALLVGAVSYWIVLLILGGWRDIAPIKHLGHL